MENGGGLRSVLNTMLLGLSLVRVQLEGQAENKHDKLLRLIANARVSHDGILKMQG
jgi:hypothetical protein